MHVEWTHRACLICTEENPLSLEHVIPDSLGGMLTSNLICKGCNSLFGHTFESQASSDPAIRIAVMNLSGDIPELSRQIIEKVDHISHGPGGTGKGRVKNGVYIEKARKEADGSVIQPTHLGRESLEARLRKAGVDRRRIARALDVFDDAPENQRIELSEGFAFVKWSIDKIEPTLAGGTPLDDLVLVKIAYEFLALHLGGAMLSDDPQLGEIRQALLQNNSSSKSFHVESLSSGEYSPHHGIRIEQGTPFIIIHIMLFDWLRYRVHFPFLSMSSERVVYTADLSTGTEFLNEEQFSSP